MDDLKMLVDMVAKLPHMALWVIALFWAYKVVVIGSIYGLIRFIVERAHSYLTTPKHKLVVHDLRLMLDGEVITGTKDALLHQIQRIKRCTGRYVHDTDVDWLKDAITEKLHREEVEKKAAPAATSAWSAKP